MFTRLQCHIYNVPSHVVCFNVSSCINYAAFSFYLVGRTHLFYTMGMLEPQMIRLLKMETCGK